MIVGKKKIKHDEQSTSPHPLRRLITPVAYAGDTWSVVGREDAVFSSRVCDKRPLHAPPKCAVVYAKLQQSRPATGTG